MQDEASTPSSWCIEEQSLESSPSRSNYSARLHRHEYTRPYKGISSSYEKLNAHPLRPSNNPLPPVADDVEQQNRTYRYNAIDHAHSHGVRDFDKSSRVIKTRLHGSEGSKQEYPRGRYQNTEASSLEDNSGYDIVPRMSFSHEVRIRA